MAFDRPRNGGITQIPLRPDLANPPHRRPLTDEARSTDPRPQSPDRLGLD
jgi:hypothetical protein